MKHLFIIDLPEILHITDDTSIYLMKELQSVGEEVYSCTEHDLAIRDKHKTCHAFSYTHTDIEKVITSHDSAHKVFDLHDFDFIHIRKDPPFDMSYVSLLLMLETLSKPHIINNPTALLKHNEKMIIFNFPLLIADTLVTSRREEIKAFIHSVGGHGVLKPLFSCRGQGIRFVNETDLTFDNEIREATDNEKQKIMVQRFEPSIVKGETRVHMIEDTPLVALRKIPKEGSFFTNLHSGAQMIPHELTKNERKLCKRVGSFLKKEGLFFTALDIIKEKLSEINMTSPSLLRQADRVYNHNFAKEWIKKLYKRYTDKKI